MTYVDGMIPSYVKTILFKNSYYMSHISCVAYWKWVCLMAVVDILVTKSQRWPWTQTKNTEKATETNGLCFDVDKTTLKVLYENFYIMYLFILFSSLRNSKSKSTVYLRHEVHTGCWFDVNEMNRIGSCMRYGIGHMSSWYLKLSTFQGHVRTSAQKYGYQNVWQ